MLFKGFGPSIRQQVPLSKWIFGPLIFTRILWVAVLRLKMVGVDGFEPSRACVSDMCVNQLRHTPIKQDASGHTTMYVALSLSYSPKMEGLAGFKPATNGLPCKVRIAVCIFGGPIRICTQTKRVRASCAAITL